MKIYLALRETTTDNKENQQMKKESTYEDDDGGTHHNDTYHKRHQDSDSIKNLLSIGTFHITLKEEKEKDNGSNQNERKFISISIDHKLFIDQ